MSREFKFRIRNTVNGGYDYVSLEYLLTHDQSSISPKNVSDDFQIMQHTGLKDKNGVDIYEGDILALENEAERSGYYTYKVVYVEEKSKFMCKSVCVGEMNDMIIVLNHYDHAGEYAVIGNIHQNPELIK